MLRVMLGRDRGGPLIVASFVPIQHRGLGENGLPPELVLTFLQLKSFNPQILSEFIIACNHLNISEILG